MKLHKIAALAGILSLSTFSVACGDDDNGDDTTVDDDDDAGDDDDDDDTGSDDDTGDDDDTPVDDDDDTPVDDDDTPVDDDDDTPVDDDDDTPVDDDDDTPVDDDDDTPVDDDDTDSGADDDDECPAVEPEEFDEPDCPPIDERGVVELEGEIGEDTEWTCDNTYYLTGLTYVVDGAVLTIGAGTEVLGDEESALVITRGSQIMAEGTPSNPIVFSSSAAPGDRSKEDWGGVVLLGDAPINAEGGEAPIEGIDPMEDRGTYGGDDTESDCGVLRYARIEFAGYLFGLDNELNGLTVGGCGSDTEIDYVQVHRGGDDGVEMFGGTADLKHIVVSGAEDDSLDWDQGFSGRVQFLAVVQDPAGSDSGIEADNRENDNDAMPRSMPTMYNFTFMGAGTNGMVLRRGTWGQLYNGIVTDFPGDGVDIRDAASAAGTEDDSLAIGYSIFYNNGEDIALDDDEDDDGGFDEAAHLAQDAYANHIDVDPMLGANDVSGPGWVPDADSPAAGNGMMPPDDGFFQCTTYIGAFEPGGDDWTADWTAYPLN